MKLLLSKPIKLFLFLSFFLTQGNLICQTLESYILLKNITEPELSNAQNSIYQAYNSNPYLTNKHFIELNSLVNTQVGGKLKINIPSVFNCENLVFNVSYSEYNDENNFGWYGYIESQIDSGCFSGTFSIVKDSGIYAGNIILDTISYEIYDLHEGTLILAETNTVGITISECGTIGVHTSSPKLIPPGGCTKNITRLVCFFSDQALLENPNIQATAALSVLQLNVINFNSLIDERVTLVGVFALPQFVENINLNGLENDVEVVFPNNTFVNNTRNLLDADICVLYTGSYPGAFGMVAGINAGINNAFAIVDNKLANTGRRTFSHEITHLYGGRHNADDENPPAEAFSFKTGRIFNKTKNFTLMHIIFSNENRIDHISNPSVTFKNENTGDNSNNNALEVQGWRENIRGIFPDITGFYVDLSASYRIGCNLDGMTATAQAYCGNPNYTYD